MLTSAASLISHPSPGRRFARAPMAFTLLPLFGLCRNEFAADREAFAEPRLDDLAGAGAMHAGDRAARNPLAARQGDAAPRRQFEQKARGPDRAVRKIARYAGADDFAVDPRRDRPALEAARSPVRNLRADHQTIIVAEIGDDGDRAELVDRTQRRACDLDSDMDRIDQVGRLGEREIRLAGGRRRANAKQEFGFAGGESFREDRHFDGAAVRGRVGAGEDRAAEPVRAELAGERRVDAADL